MRRTENIFAIGRQRLAVMRALHVEGRVIAVRALTKQDIKIHGGISYNMLLLTRFELAQINFNITMCGALLYYRQVYATLQKRCGNK